MELDRKEMIFDWWLLEFYFCRFGEVCMAVHTYIFLVIVWDYWRGKIDGLSDYWRFLEYDIGNWVVSINWRLTCQNYNDLTIAYVNRCKRTKLGAWQRKQRSAGSLCICTHFFEVLSNRLFERLNTISRFLLISVHNIE